MLSMQDARKANMTVSRLRALREEREIPAARLAEQCRVSRQTIYAIEDGSFVPNTLVALRLARELGVAVEELFSLEGDAPGISEVQAVFPPGRPGTAGQPQLVRLIDGDKGPLAVPVQNLLHFLPPADGTSKGGSRRKLTVQTTHQQETSRSAYILIAGCDPAISVLADLARSQRIEVIPIPASSRQALKWLAEGKVHIAGSHLFDPGSGEYNRSAVRSAFPKGGVRALTFARWETGLVTSPANPKKLRSIADLASKGVKIVNRERGSGCRAQLDAELKSAGIPANSIEGYEHVAYGHLPAAFCVANAWADVCLASRSAALCYGLHFVPLRTEQFDFVLPETFIRTPRGGALADLMNRAVLRRKLALVTGYETSRTGHSVIG